MEDGHTAPPMNEKTTHRKRGCVYVCLCVLQPAFTQEISQCVGSETLAEWLLVLQAKVSEVPQTLGRN